MTSLPPLPAAILTPYQKRKRLEKLMSVRQFAESGGLYTPGASPDDDALQALKAAFDAGVAPDKLQALVDQATNTHKTGFKDRFFGALRAVGLPFESFAEGINSLIGPAVPQAKFQERSGQSRAIIKSMFGGDISPAEAAGALRDIYEQRSGIEQLLTGFVFDPTNLLVPGASALKAGLTTVAKAGLQAGLQAGVKAGARTGIEWTLPYVGGKLTGKLGLRDVERGLNKVLKTSTPDEVVARRIQRPAASYRIAGGEETSSIFPRLSAEEHDSLRSGMSVFYEALQHPDEYADIRGFDILQKLYKATTLSTGEASLAERALFQLTLESAGRGPEAAWIRAADVLLDENRVIFRDVGRTPGAGRATPPLTSQTMDLLRQLKGSKEGDAPLFTKGELLGITGKTANDPLGKGFNTWFGNLAIRAHVGGAIPKGATIRNLVASAYYSLLERGGAPVSLTRHFLGHADRRLFTHYAARAGDAPMNRSMKRFMDADEQFVPLKTRIISTGAPGVAGAAERLAQEVKAEPAFKDLISRKGKSAARVAKTAQGLRGEAKLDQLELTDAELWVPRFAAIASAQDHDLLLDALHAIEARRTIYQLEQAEEGARLVQEIAGKGSPITIRMNKFAQAAFTERQTLALGLRGRLTSELAPNFSKLRTILGDLKAQGLISDEGMQAFMDSMEVLDNTVNAALETTKSGFIPQRVSVATKTLKDLHMTAPETAEMFKLSGLENTDVPSAKAAIGEWLDNEKVRTILRMMDIRVDLVDGVWKVQMGPAALVTRLHRMAQVGSTTQHILGADLLKPVASVLENTNRRFVRAQTIAAVIAEAGRLDTHDWLISEAAKAVARPLRFVDEGELEAVATPGLRAKEIPEGPFLSRTDEPTAQVAELLQPRPLVEHEFHTAITSNERITRLREGLLKGALESDSLLVYGPARIGDKLLTLLSLHGASAGLKTVDRYFFTWRSIINKLVVERGLRKSRIAQMPGHKSLVAKLIDPMAPDAWFSDALEFADTLETTQIWRTYISHPSFVGLGVKAAPDAVREALRNPMVLFGEEIPFDKLTDVYKLSSGELDVVALARAISKETTRQAINDVGLSRVTTFLGRTPSLSYMPRIVARLRSKKLVVSSLEQRLLMQPLDFAEARKIPTGIEAYHEGARYIWPVDAALEYAADMSRLTVDHELIKLMEKNGVFETGGAKMWLDRTEAAGTLRRLADGIVAGKPPHVEVAYLSKLLNFQNADVLKDALARQLGRLAKDLLEKPERVKDLLPDIDKAIASINEAHDAAVGLHDMTKGLPGLGRAWFSDTIAAKRAVQYFEEQSKTLTKPLHTLNAASAFLRMAQAGVDLSFLFIQGSLLLVNNPVAWARAARASFRVIGNNEAMRAFESGHLESIRRLVAHGGVWQAPEFVEGAGSLSRVWGGVPVVGHGLKNLPDAAERMFTAYLLHARLNLWEALEPMAFGDAGKLRELANHVNKMTGVYNPATAGVTQFQRYMEGTFLSFAPMYRRAAYGLVVDAFRGLPTTGRLDVQLAQKSLIKLAAVAAALSFVAEQSGNNPDALNPASAKFMAFRVGDHYIGIGTAYYGLVRAIYAVTEQALNPDKRSGLAHVNVRDNQLLRWWRSQAPPLLQGGIDLALGQSYIGEPLRGDGGGFTAAAFGKWGLEQVTPMVVESTIRELRSPEDVVPVLGESFGARTFPMSLRERERRLSNNILLLEDDPEIVAWRTSQEHSGQPLEFEFLPKLLQTRIINQHQDLMDLRQQVDADALSRGSTEIQERTRYFQQTVKNRTYITKQMVSAAAAFLETKDSAKFRDTIGNIQTAAAALAIQTGDQFPDVKAWLNDQKVGRAEKATTFQGDVLYDRYYQNVVFNPLTRDKNDNFLPHIREALDAQFKAQYGLDWWDYIQRRRREARQYPDLVAEYFDAKETLTPYWQLHRDLWGEFSQNAQAIDAYNEASPLDKELMKDESPRLRRLLRILDRAKTQLRTKNPELDWLLVKWYGRSPITRLATERRESWFAS